MASNGFVLTNIGQQTADFVTDFFKKNISTEYTFHDLQHTLNVVQGVKELGEYNQLGANDLEILELAAWFHDTGYDCGADGHEMRSADYAAHFLGQYAYPTENVLRIRGCIAATKLTEKPTNLLEEIISDADLSHLGKKNYWEKCDRLRQEILTTKKYEMTDAAWIDFELAFMNEHQYHTVAARDLYGKRKEKHVRRLLKDKALLDSQNEHSTSGRLEDKKDDKLGRGVETMFRTTYRTHISLSSTADSKAHIMLSINTIVISLLIGGFEKKFAGQPQFVLPTIILLTVCLLSMIFATLSTRPKITEGRVTREDILQRKGNLLFFGNFYNMKLEEFHWGMMEMLKDGDYLYSSMTRDLYYLGVVLAKKYKYLSYCYSIFMYGLIISVIAFAIAFLF